MHVIVTGLVFLVVAAGATQAPAATAELPYAATAAFLVDPFDQCRSQPDGTPCDDGAACTTSSACHNGVCVSASPTCRNFSDAQDRSYCSLETGGCVSQTESCAPFFIDAANNENKCIRNAGTDPATGECLYDGIAQACVPPGCIRYRCDPTDGVCKLNENDPTFAQCGGDESFCQPRPDCVTQTCFFESCSAQGSPQNCDSITNVNCTALNPSSCQVPLETSPPDNIINGCKETVGCVFSVKECPPAAPCQRLVRDPLDPGCCRYEPRDCAAEFHNDPQFAYACDVVGTEGVCRARPLPKFPIGAKTIRIRPAESFELFAKGDLILPAAVGDDPTTEGGALTFTGTTGGQTYALPAEGWKALAGGRGFRFVKNLCKVVIERKSVRAKCRVDTGDFGPLPEPGPVDVMLSIGDGTRYCSQCGGTPTGEPTHVFRRKNCTPPAECN